MEDWLVEGIVEGEVMEVRREVVNGLVEFGAESELVEGGREVVDRVVKV